MISRKHSDTSVLLLGVEGRRTLVGGLGILRPANVAPGLQAERGGGASPPVRLPSGHEAHIGTSAIL